MITEDGFEVRFGPWQVGLETVVRMGYVYWQDQELGSCPGVITLKEWNKGRPNPDLLKALGENHIQALNDIGLMKLGLDIITKKPLKRIS